MGRTVLHVQPDSASRASSSRSREFALPPAISSSGPSAAGSVWTDILSLLLIFAAAGSGLLLLSKSVPVLQAQCPPSTSLEAAASAINASCEVTAEPTAISLPNSLEDVKALYNLLHRYTAHHFTWLVGAFAYVYVFKQAFSIPGSAFLNCLAGALFGLGFGFPFVCCLTAAGTSCCYWMSYFFGRRLADRAFADRISELRVTLTDHKERGNLLPFLLFIRLFPMSPNFLLNMASPLLGVPYHYFLISVFFGLMPYNFICVHAGTVLGHLRSWDDVLNPRVLLELASVAVLVLAFSAVTKRFQHRGAVSAPSKAAKPSSPPSIEPAERKRRVSENGAEALRARRPVPADSRGTQAAR